MTAAATAAMFIIGVALGLIGYAWITAPERRRTRINVRRRDWADAKREAELRRIVDQRDRWMNRCGDLEREYLKALRQNEALREHIGDEREAAAVQALADSPAYFDALAAREAVSIDREWFDLSGDER